MVRRLGYQQQQRPDGGSAEPSAREHWATSWGAARDGARTVLTRVQASTLVVLVVFGVVVLGTIPRYGLIACIAMLTALYFVSDVHKIWLLIRGEVSGFTATEPAACADGGELPPYTVLVPLYKEARILPKLLATYPGQSMGAAEPAASPAGRG